MDDEDRIPLTRLTQSVEEFGEQVSELFVPLRVTAARGTRAFEGRIVSATAGELRYAVIDASPHLVERTAALVEADCEELIKVSMMLAGRGSFTQSGREAVLGAGDLAVYDTRLPYSLSFDDRFSVLVVMFPRGFLDLPPGMTRALTAVQIDGATGVGAMLRAFLTRLARNLNELGTPAAPRLSATVLDLVTTGLQSQARAAPDQALLLRIQEYIERHLPAADLGPDRIAASHHLSARRLQQLFHEQGISVAGWIRSRRLERCRRDLADPLLAARTVAAIGARWGFPSAQHFSRTFKAEFGCTPAEYRKGARSARPGWLSGGAEPPGLAVDAHP